jgi:hypothetical protein
MKAMNNLLAVLQSQSNYEIAEELGRNVLEKRCRLQSPKHSDTRVGMNKLAVVMQFQGD